MKHSAVVAFYGGDQVLHTLFGKICDTRLAVFVCWCSLSIVFYTWFWNVLRFGWFEHQQKSSVWKLWVIDCLWGNDPNLQDDFDGKQCFTLINLISVRFPEVLPGMFRSTAQFSTKLSKKILKKVKSASPYSMNLVFSTTNCMPLFWTPTNNLLMIRVLTVKNSMTGNMGMSILFEVELSDHFWKSWCHKINCDNLWYSSEFTEG